MSRQIRSSTGHCGGSTSLRDHRTIASTGRLAGCVLQGAVHFPENSGHVVSDRSFEPPSEQAAACCPTRSHGGRVRANARARWFACDLLGGTARTACGAGGSQLPHARALVLPQIECVLVREPVEQPAEQAAACCPTRQRLSLPKSSRPCIVRPMGGNGGEMVHLESASPGSIRGLARRGMRPAGQDP